MRRSIRSFADDEGEPRWWLVVVLGWQDGWMELFGGAVEAKRANPNSVGWRDRLEERLEKTMKGISRLKGGIV
jgi:hypothetical protein